MEPTPLSELRATLTKLARKRLEAEQLIKDVPQGPGYYEAVQPLKARQQQLDAEFKAIQQQIKTRQAGNQPALF